MINKIKEFFKDKIFNKVKKIFKKEDKIVERVILNENIVVEESDINKRVHNFLDGTNCTIKDFLNIDKKIEELKKDEEDVDRLDEFLIQNENIEKNKRMLMIIDKIYSLLNNRNRKLQGNVQKCKKFINFMVSNDMKCVDGFAKLYEKMLILDDYEKRMEILDSYIDNNESAKNEILLINEIEFLLDKNADLETLAQMNNLEVEINNINDEIDYEYVVGAYFYDVEKVEKLNSEYRILNNEYNEINKKLTLKR